MDNKFTKLKLVGVGLIAIMIYVVTIAKMESVRQLDVDGLWKNDKTQKTSKD